MLSGKDLKNDSDLELKYQDAHGIESNVGEREPLIEQLEKKNPSIGKDDIFVDDREMRSEIGKYCAIKLSYREA